MKRIAIDMDEVMVDTLPALIRSYNAEFGETLAMEQLMGYDLPELLPIERRDRIHAYLLVEGFLQGLDVMPDSQRVIEALSKRYEIFITTAAMDIPYSFNGKFEWLQEHFPFVPVSNLVFCGDKSVIQADYLIDDRPRHFERFVGQGVLFNAPHNQAETRYPRVNSWEDVERMFLA